MKFISIFLNTKAIDKGAAYRRPPNNAEMERIMKPIHMMISKYNFKLGEASRIRYIVIHYTGGFASAENNCRYFAGADRRASAHYFVDYDGEIWQSVEDENIAWHCGAGSYIHPECRNANSLGIELCVQKKDRGSKKAEDEDWYFEDATVEAAVELTRYLMEKYDVPAANVLRHYDVTGKICPAPYCHNKTEHTWEEFQRAIAVKEEKNGKENRKNKRPLDQLFARIRKPFEKRQQAKEEDGGRHSIMGSSVVRASQIASYIKEKNASAAYFAKKLSQLYIEEGICEGVRGDIAAAQAMVETGNLTFTGSAVTLDQNNFCGLGVTANGMKGCSFKTMQDGVRVHIQHLKAYAGKEGLMNCCIDPRYAYVEKGCAPYVEWLGQKENPGGKGWASGAGYGAKICRVLDEMKQQKE